MSVCSKGRLGPHFLKKVVFVGDPSSIIEARAAIVWTPALLVPECPLLFILVDVVCVHHVRRVHRVVIAAVYIAS